MPRSLPCNMTGTLLACWRVTLTLEINSRCCSSPVVEKEGSPCIRVMQKPLGEGEESSYAGRRAPAADWSRQAPSRGGSAAAAQDSHSRLAYTKKTAHERC